MPLPAMHPAPSTAKLIWGNIAIWSTIVIWVLYVVSVVFAQLVGGAFDTTLRIVEAVSYVLVVTFLMFSALMYLVARQGAYGRFLHHERVPRAELDDHFGSTHEPLTVLVPSYAEEPAVVRKTLWSAALQEYPSLRVVLLLDDNPEPADESDAERLATTRAVPAEIEAALREPAERFSDAWLECSHQLMIDGVPVETVMPGLAAEYRAGVEWLRAMADAERDEDHVDDFFIGEVLEGLADDLEETAIAVEAAIAAEHALKPERIQQLLRRLAWIFSAEVTSFERKRYASLSHEANKAMNLNSYIGLIGGRYQEHETPDGRMLRYVPGTEPADFVIPNSEFILTLDADSLLLRDYCLRLVYFLEQPENSRVAVTQTPYSSFRGAPSRIERLAGATTDVQHILHQGMTAHNATFWVGANAVIRMEALDDILEIESSGGLDVRRYVQDRTVIEDTESSVDLGEHRWTLVNYPERLSYSATPPDFGSLVVQRRRWANGGLVILPKLWQQMRERRRDGMPMKAMEVALRANYLASIMWASFGLVFLLIYPYDSRLVSPLVFLGAVPYFAAMASDLHYTGYKRTDIFRIYGFNLILLPVNLAGVLKSIQQAITAKKIPFARTPKVRDRTAAPFVFVVVPYIIVGFSAYIAWQSFFQENWWLFGFASFNTVCAMGAIIAYIGIWNSVVDVWLGLTDWMWVEASKGKHANSDAATLDWQAALYRGAAAPGENTRGTRRERPIAETPQQQSESPDPALIDDRPTGDAPATGEHSADSAHAV